MLLIKWMKREKKKKMKKRNETAHDVKNKQADICWMDYGNRK